MSTRRPSKLGSLLSGFALMGLVAAAMLPATSASAGGWGRHGGGWGGGYGRGGGYWGGAAAAGVLGGLALGAVLSSQSYYGNGYGYGYGYGYPAYSGYGYGYPAYSGDYYGAGYGYAAPRRRCYTAQQAVTDFWGNVEGYQPVRVCQ
jgi:hypothetical protein